MKKTIALATLVLGFAAGLVYVSPIIEARVSSSVLQATPTLSINDVSTAEGNPDTHPLIFTVTVTGAHPVVTVQYATADGPPPNGAMAGSDYFPGSGTVTFPASGSTATRIVSVEIQEDRTQEPDETFFVNLSNATGATITDAQGVGTILNDDGGPVTPSLSISDVSVTEGDAGTVNAIFTVSLSAASTSQVTVDYATADATATVADNDYQSRSGVVTFPASDASPRTVVVPVVGDTRFEMNETFFVNLTNAVGAAVADGQGVCTTINDDPAPPLPTLSISDLSVTEGASGTVSATFMVRLSAASTSPVTVGYATADGTATLADNDYQNRSGVVTFPANDLSPQPVSVPVVGDTRVEPNETLSVNLSSPVGATIADGQGICTIVDDDNPPPLPSLAVNDVSINEGNAGTVNAVFTVSLSAAGANAITVNYATADGTASVADSDYQSRSGMVTFPANDASPQTITVPLVGDTRVEPNEIFFVDLNGAGGATIADAQGTCTIINDDGAALPTLFINDVSLNEGNTGKVDAVFVLTLSEASASAITVNYATADGTATVADNDYQSQSGVATVPANRVFAVIRVPLVGDTRAEPNETFFVNFSNPGGATIAEGQRICTIINDDGFSAQPTLSIHDVTVNEGDTGTAQAVFTVSVSAAGATAITVNYATVDGTATVADNDYQSRSGVVIFPANDASPQRISVPIIGDTRSEPNEVFLLRLSGATGAAIANDTAACSVFNDDRRCSYSTSPAEQRFPIEGGTGSFTVTLSSDCDWYADPLQSWITITSGGSGTGNGTVTYSIRTNTEDGVVRDGLIRIFERNTLLAVLLFRIEQDPAPCTYSLRPTSVSVGAGATSGIVDVITPQGCPFTAISSVPWIAVSGASSESVHYQVEPNSGPSRTGTITIANQTLTVHQTGSCPASEYMISPGGQQFGETGGVSSIAITTSPGCVWRATTDTPWIKLLSLAGEGNGSVLYSVEDNDGTERGGLISINDEIPFTIVQRNPGPPNCIFDFICRILPDACGLGDGSMAQARSFRDSVLVRSERGRKYTRLYYQLSSEAIGVVMLNPSLILRSQEMLERYRPVIDLMIKGEQVTLTRGDLDDLDSFLSSFAAKGSSDLRQNLNGLRQDLRDPQVHSEFNINITDGPARQLKPQNKSQTMNRSGGLSLWLGLAVGGVLLLGLGRRNRREATLSILLPFLLIGPQTRVPFSQQQTNFGVGYASPSLQSPGGARSTPRRTDGGRPPGFEANGGQADAKVKFISRGPNYNLYLGPAEATMSLTTRDAGVDPHEQKPGGRGKVMSTDAPGFLRMHLVGANPDPRIHGLAELSGRTNYFRGRDTAKWQTNLSTFAQVKYDCVYDGVDLVFHGSQRQLEYDFIVAPGADPDRIRLRFDGADSIETDPHGDLVLRVAGGEVRQCRPVVYQDIDGERRFIDGHYAIDREHTRSEDEALVAHDPAHAAGRVTETPSLVGFQIGSYDRSRPLVIDPVLEYSTYFGGSGTEEGTSTAVDSSGNSYVTGLTDSVDFPLANALQPKLRGGRQDAFVFKLDPSGRLIYSTYIGGNGQDNANALAVDEAGNAYITGFTDSTDFPVKSALQERNKGSFNAFVMKLSPTGSILNSTLLGGSVSDFGSGIAVDAAGNIYTAGISTSHDFPSVAAMQQTPGGLVDGYVAKIDSSGSRLVYSTLLGGVGIDAVTGIAADSQGGVYLTGLTSSADFRTVNAAQPAHGGGVFDAFVSKLNTSGGHVYSTYLGGRGEDRAFRVAVDSAGNAYVTGDTDSTDFPTVNALQPTRGGSTDAFVAKFNASGSTLLYSTYLGGSGIDGATALAVNATGEAYVAGFTNSTNFPTVRPIQAGYAGGSFDAFVAKISASGATLDYSTHLGGSGIDSGFGIAVDPAGDAYVIGVTDSTNFPTLNPLQASNRGGTSDLFIAKIKSGPTISSASISGTKLMVFGKGFDDGATILLNGQPQKSSNNALSPTTTLVSRKTGKRIEPGKAVTLQVRNPDGAMSNELSFTRQ